MELRAIISVFIWAVSLKIVETIVHPDNYYAKFNTLGEPKHTLTWYKGVGQKCNIGSRFKVVKSGPLTEEEKEYFVRAHNMYRRKVASGGEKKGILGPQPPAANMLEMFWDEELAAIAQRWAEQCPEDHESEGNRKTDRWEWVGQNKYTDSVTIAYLPNRLSSIVKAGVNASVSFWYQELTKFNKYSISPFFSDPSTLHYTQLVWAESNMLGCGFFMTKDEDESRSSTGNKFKRYIICNYGPGGNINGYTMYELGTTASKCPTGTEENFGLCSLSCINDEFYCASGEIIAIKKLCDGTRDCGNGEDEDSCLTRNKTRRMIKVPQNRFRCFSGFCIHTKRVCDEYADCPDSDDEHNCSVSNTKTSTVSSLFSPAVFRTGRVKCNKTMFRCKSGQCIPGKWKCDKEKDCIHGEDEVDCVSATTTSTTMKSNKTTASTLLEFQTCSSDKFMCRTGDCIPLSWQCDEIADCPNHEDENNCIYENISTPKPEATSSTATFLGFFKCNSTMFRCNSGICILESWRCDGDKDCLNGEDEAMCCPHSDPFWCDDGKCILSSWACDGEEDCIGGRDEKNCSTDTKKLRHTSTTVRTACQPGIEFQCTDKTCIPMSLTCDQYPDCPDWRDESKSLCRCHPIIEFRCADNTCIPKSSACNLYPDCPDWSDEDQIMCSPVLFKSTSTAVRTTTTTKSQGNVICRSSEFRCNSGQCIPLSGKCDGIRTCDDGGDEDDCTRTCSSSAFRCDNGRCIPLSWKCDGISTCDSGEDEEGCDAGTCGSGAFRCNSGQCIPLSWKCDGMAACKDGEDEEDCICDTKNEFQCMDKTCVQRTSVCDLRLDCLDWSDENQLMCQCNQNSEFQCMDNTCILRTSLCDGKLDCLDWSDENKILCGTTTTTTTSTTTSTTTTAATTTTTTPEPRNVCHPGTEFQCRDATCIARISVCNGILDCRDWSDENRTICLCNKGSEFQCDDGSCIPRSSVCDLRLDCPDWSDENKLMCGLYAQVANALIMPEATTKMVTTTARKECIPDIEFQCGDGSCLAKEKVCDFSPDCLDWSDEEVHMCQSFACDSNKFRCNDGQCIPKTWTCDGILACRNGEDEENCITGSGTCSSDKFRCDSGKCIPSAWRCDGIPACSSGEDEENCNSSECESDKFRCKKGQCIPLAKKCDGNSDCEDGEDENNCCQFSSGAFWCNDGQCIPAVWRCDGEADCSSQEDEKNCTCPENMFSCGGVEPACIDLHWVCDGVVDCPYSRDEKTETCRSIICGSNDFQCENGQCVSSFMQCDGMPDCYDHSDEEYCFGRTSDKSSSDQDNMIDESRTFSSLKCSRAKCRCNNGQSIHRRQKCDGEANCPGGEDEKHCIYRTIGSTTKDTAKAKVSRTMGSVTPESKGSFQCGNVKCRCKNGRDIQKSQICDGKADCKAGEDEEKCSPSTPNKNKTVRTNTVAKTTAARTTQKNKTAKSTTMSTAGSHFCSTDEFRCYNGECIPLSRLCDGKLHCRNGEDEKTCCIYNNPFWCKDGQCIAYNWKCDGQKDCSAGEDEENCCPFNDPFWCEDGRCIPITCQCDGLSDCAGGEDEANCSTSTTTTPKSSTITTQEFATCNSNQYLCNNGVCIRKRWQCDRMVDCDDGEDEENCSVTTAFEEMLKEKRDLQTLSSHYNTIDILKDKDNAIHNDVPQMPGSITVTVSDWARLKNAADISHVISRLVQNRPRIDIDLPLMNKVALQSIMKVLFRHFNDIKENTIHKLTELYKRKPAVFGLLQAIQQIPDALSILFTTAQSPEKISRIIRALNNNSLNASDTSPISSFFMTPEGTNMSAISNIVKFILGVDYTELAAQLSPDTFYKSKSIGNIVSGLQTVLSAIRNGLKYFDWSWLLTILKKIMELAEQVNRDLKEDPFKIIEMKYWKTFWENLINITGESPIRLLKETLSKVAGIFPIFSEESQYYINIPDIVSTCLDMLMNKTEISLGKDLVVRMKLPEPAVLWKVAEYMMNIFKGAPTCGREEFQCYNGACIHISRTCNKIRDCEQGEDEEYCYPQVAKTTATDSSSTELGSLYCGKLVCYCYNGESISKRLMCNGVRDCSYGEDEESCYNQVTTTAKPTTVLTDVHATTVAASTTPVTDEPSTSISTPTDDLISSTPFPTATVIADITNDTTTPTTEDDIVTSTPTTLTPTAPLMCKSISCRCGNGKMISRRRLCDRIPDCSNGEDEDNCPATTTTAKTHTTSTTKASLACRGNVCRCGNGKRISIRRLCDEIPDCLNGEDEENCYAGTTKGKPSTASAYKGPIRCGSIRCVCSNGRKIPKRRLCDRLADCSEGEDEKYCLMRTTKTATRVITTPKEGFFICGYNRCQCANGQLILTKQRCDGLRDCSKGEDEQNCPGITKPTEATTSFTRRAPIKCGSFKCRCHSGVIISKRKTCNGRPDCSNGEDEKNCPHITRTTQALTTSYKGPMKCGIAKCRCYNGLVISMRRICDGLPDCSSGEDELNCSPPATQPTTAKLATAPKDKITEKRAAEETVTTDTTVTQKRTTEETSITDATAQKRTTKETFMTGTMGALRCDSAKCQCNDGLNIYKWQLCDERQDCREGEDEKNCYVDTTISTRMTTTSTEGLLSTTAKMVEMAETKGILGSAMCDDIKCQCNDGLPIFKHQWCDGRADCRFGEDEINCVLETDAISTAGSTIPKTDAISTEGSTVLKTDAISTEGSTGSQTYITTSTTEHTIATSKKTSTATPRIAKFYTACGKTLCRCSNNHYIPKSRQCDGYADCSHGEDEDNCPTDGPVAKDVLTAVFESRRRRRRDFLACGRQRCRCSNDKYISRKLKCDGFTDCEYGEDEHNCPNSGGKTSSKPTTSRIARVAPAHPTCGSNQFQCLNGECISSRRKCDNIADCKNGEDESNCLT